MLSSFIFHIDKVTDALSNKKRKKTLSDAQLEVMANLFHTSGLVFTLDTQQAKWSQLANIYLNFEVATSYYRMKKRKLELEIEALIAKKKQGNNNHCDLVMSFTC